MNILLKITEKYLFNMREKKTQNGGFTAVLKVYFINSFVKRTMGISQKS